MNDDSFYFTVHNSMDTFGNFPGSVVNNLEVKGDLTVDGSIIGPSIMFEKIYTADGDETAPAYSYVDEKNTGIYRSGPGEVSVTGRGVKRLRIGETSSESSGTWTSTKFYSDDGTVSAPSVAYSTEPGTGMYRRAAGEISFSSTGSEKLRITSTGIVTPESITSSRNYTTDGSDLVPSYSFQNDGGTGMYRSGVGVISFSAQTIESFRISPTLSYCSGDFKAVGDITCERLFPQSSTMIDVPFQGADVKIQTADPLDLKQFGITSARFNGTSVTIPGDLAATTISCTTATISTLSAPTLTSTTSSLGTATASSITATNQILTTFNTSSYVGIGNTSFVAYSGWNTTPITSRGVSPVTVSGATFTINETGYYDIGFQILWVSNATGQRSATWRFNGASTCYAYDIRNAITTAGQITSNMGSIRRYCTAGDTAFVEVWQNSGGSLDIGNNGNQIVGASFMKLC